MEDKKACEEVIRILLDHPGFIVREVKEQEEGVESMCKILEEERSEGRKEGSARINELNRRLLKDGRKDDIVRSLEEPKYQEQLLEEYGL